MVVMIPGWFWILVAGIVTVITFTVLTGKFYRRSAFDRALWCTVQIGSGLVLLFAAQFWALIKVAPEDESLSAKDMMVPARLWGVAIKRLPSTRLQVWIAAWALAAIISASILIGGLDHWLKYLPKPSKAALVPPCNTRYA
jgi:hypothetical protein